MQPLKKKKAGAKTMPETVHAYVVDDEPVVQMTLAKLLESQDYPVATFGSAEDFKAKASVDEPFLLIVDKNLPGISGLDLVVQQQQQGSDFEAILITGYADLDSAIDAVRLGFYSYIRKPFDFEKLLEDLTGAKSRLAKRLEGGEVNISPILEELMEPVTSAEIHINSVLTALQDVKVSDATRENLEYAYARLQTVENSLEQRLTAERLEDGIDELIREPVLLLETLNNVIHEMSALSSKVRIPLWLEAKAEVTVDSHQALLRQLIKSLVTIALEFGEPGNPVVLDVDRIEDGDVATLHMVIMGNKAENPEGNEQNKFCRRLAQSINAELIIKPYLDDMGFEYTLRLPIK
jgi:FixJ family two-component response regulator